MTHPKLGQIITVLLPTILLLAFCLPVRANNGMESGLAQTATVQQAEIDWLGAQLNLQRWKQDQLALLHAEGHATWMEFRRQQFKADMLETQLQSAEKHLEFIQHLNLAASSQPTDSSIRFRERSSRPIKVFLPGSIRLVGWIENPNLKLSTDKSFDHEAAIATVRDRRDKANKRFDHASTASVSDDWKKKTELDLAVAETHLAYLLVNQNNPFDSSPAIDLSELAEIADQHISVNHSTTLGQATQAVCRAEAGARGHLECARIQLRREQNRYKAIYQLHIEGHASAKELSNAQKRVSDVQLQLDSLELASLPTYENTYAIDEDVQFHETQWPDAILSDIEYALHLTSLRQRRHQEQANIKTEKLKAEFLLEIHDRLTRALQPTESASSELDEGQRNEIKTYTIDWEYALAKQAYSTEREQILALEEQRFIQQAVALHQAAQDRLAHSPSPSWILELLGPFQPTTWIGANWTKAVSRLSYLEFGNQNIPLSQLTLSPSGREYIETPTYRFDSLRLNYLRPPSVPKSPLMVSDARRPYSESRRLAVEPAWMRHFHRNLRYNSFQVMRMSGPPYYDAWPQKVFYGQYGYRAFGGSYGYPNQILRADWRSNLTPGWVPWYAPGSPVNIRANQLYYYRKVRPAAPRYSDYAD